MHHIHIHVRLDPSWTWLPLPYHFYDGAIEKEIYEWVPKWRPADVVHNMVYPKNIRKDKQTEGIVPLQSASVEKQACRVTESLATERARIEQEEATARRTAEESALGTTEEATTKATQDATALQTNDPPYTVSEMEDDDETEDEEVDQDQANLLPDEGEDDEDQTELVVGDKRKADDNPSQTGKRFKRKASNLNMVHNLTTDYIDMIAMHVGVSTEEALVNFQDKQKKNLDEMAQ